MRRAGIFLAAAVVASSVVAPVQAGPKQRGRARVPVATNAGPTRIPGEVVVAYERGVARSQARAIRANAETELVERTTKRIEVVAAERGNVAATVAALEAQPGVAFAEPNFIYRASAVTPNDPRFTSQWGLNNTGQSVSGATGTADADIDAPEAWGAGTGSADVVVAVVDTGVAVDHPDLASNIWTNPGETGSGKETNGIDDDANGFVDDWRGWDFVDKDNTPRDLVGHGTHVAGIIGARGNDSTGVTGVNWDVSIMPLRVLGADGAGSTADVAAGFLYARDMGADVVNASLGGPDPSVAVSSAITASPDVLFAVAAGNEGVNTDVSGSYPCNYPDAHLVCVAATDQNDTLAGYSNYGAAHVDLGAPGSRILSDVPAFYRSTRETFEADIATTWTTGGTGGTWGRALDSYGYYLTDSPSGNYAANADSWIHMTEPADLSGRVNCQLSFVMALATESRNDAFHVEASSDATTWAPVKSFAGSTGGEWRSEAADLSGFDGRSTYIRFRLTSNALLEDDGVSLDDVQIRCLTSNYSGTEYGYFSGTSMATPQVAGAAALLLSLVPSSSVATLKGGLMSGVDPLDSLFGKTVSGGRLNAFESIGVMAPSALPVVEPPPTGGGESSPSPSPTPTESPSEEPSPTPEPSPTEDPVDPPLHVDHGRQVSLELRRHLRLSGQVLVADALPVCNAEVKVKIKRNGKLLKKVTTDATGAFKTKVRDRKGRYRVIVPSFDIEGGRCLWARSEVRRHRHV